MSWIDDYMAYTSSQVSPRLFHQWAALATIGATIGRRCWLQRGYFYIYPGQLMVVLVSASAITKKTTAASLAVDFLRVLEPWQILVLPKKTSPQQLLKSLERLTDDRTPQKDSQGRRVDSCGFIWAGELGTFFSKEAFAETLATHINDLNDAPRGKISIEYRSWKATLWNPCVGLLGCITPKGLAEELPAVARQAGFFGRVLWICQDSTDRFNSLTEPMPELREQKIVLQESLRDIALMEGPFGWTKQGRAAFDGWYYDVYAKAMRMRDDDQSADTGYWGRKDSHILRVAMTLSAAESRERRLTQRIVELAIRWVDEIERYFPLGFSQLEVNPHTEYERKLLDVVELRGANKDGNWVKREAVIRNMWRSGGLRRFEDAEATLLAAGELERRRFNDDYELRRRREAGPRVSREEGAANA